MSAKPPRHHHYVPQFYLRNFGNDGKVFAFNTEIESLFRPSPRNIAGERDLYKLEGSDPQLAEKMFGEIETSLTPILSKIIATEALPFNDSDEFVSLLYFLATLVARHPRQLKKIEDFTKTVLQRTVEIFAANIPKEGKTLIDGQHVTPQQAREAVEALNAGRIKMHVPRDQSLATSLKTVESITELLMRRSWTLVTANENLFITSSKPVLLLWDDLSMHLRHPAGFGLQNTTVHFPISPRLMMIGKFSSLKEKCTLDSKAVAAINGLHGIFSPQYLVSQSDETTILVHSNLVPFKDLKKAYQTMRANQKEKATVK